MVCFFVIVSLLGGPRELAPRAFANDSLRTACAFAAVCYSREFVLPVASLELSGSECEEMSYLGTGELNIRKVQTPRSVRLATVPLLRVIHSPIIMYIRSYFKVSLPDLTR